LSDPERGTDAPDAAAAEVDAARRVAEEIAAERGAHAYRVSLENFEGPLDLLLHLIQQHELDIMDIPIRFVTEKYVEYIMLMQELNIDIASEYLVMAATLTHIKSKMMLPPEPGSEDAEELEPEDDPRLELVRRLLEYQKYKRAAEQLADRSIFGRDVFGRGLSAPEVEGQAPLAPLSLFKLLDAFQGVLSRAKTVLDHEIQLDRLSISDRINQLADLLRASPRLNFEDLFQGQRTRPELIVTFLAVLEMTRLRMTRLYQDDALGPIRVELAVREEDVEDLADAATKSIGVGDSMPPVAAREPSVAPGGGEAAAVPHAEAAPEPESVSETEAEPEPEADSEPEAEPPRDESDEETQ
jgi:segregation and condensation protein A